jgi:hypothetical protein
MKKMSQKSRVVLKALAKVRSYDQVTAVNNTLTSHDVFRALSESPTSFWSKKSSPKRKRGTSLS